MKLHLGCGSIYLQGYINIDAFIDKFAVDCSAEELKPHLTTLDNYYKYGFCKGPKGTIADLKVDFTKKIPFDNVEEIVMIQVFEHIPQYNRNVVLGEIQRVLKPGGNLIIGVPDIKETAKLLVNAKSLQEEEWVIRLLYGTQRNKYSHHYCGYTKQNLQNLLSQFGFNKFEELPNLNFYPAIYLKAIKE